MHLIELHIHFLTPAKTDILMSMAAIWTEDRGLAMSGTPHRLVIEEATNDQAGDLAQILVNQCTQWGLVFGDAIPGTVWCHIEDIYC